MYQHTRVDDVRQAYFFEHEPGHFPDLCCQGTCWSRFARGLKGAGDIIVPDRPGNGIDWNEDAVKRYAI
jgi:hypothetical protein